jgi:hypothetical protein
MDHRGPAGRRLREPHPRLGEHPVALTGPRLARSNRAGIWGDPARCRRVAVRVRALGRAIARGPHVAAGGDRGGSARLRRRGGAPLRRAFRGAAHGGQRGAGRSHRTGGTDLQLERTLAGGGALVGHRLRAGVAAIEALDARRAVRHTVSLVAGGRVGRTRGVREFALAAAYLGGHLRTELRLSERAPLGRGWTAAQGLGVAGRARIAAGGGHRGVVWRVGARGRGVGIGSLLDGVGGGAARPLLAAVALDSRRAVWNAAAIAWTLVLAVCGNAPHTSLATYAWCAIGAAGLAAWGIRDGRAERVNLAVAGLAITVLAFLLLERHGQAGPLRKPDRDRPSVSGRRLGVGADAPAAVGAYVAPQMSKEAL